jgi:hypothetical protein
LNNRRVRWFFGLWLLAVIGGFTALSRYSLIPGPPAMAAAHWPQDIALSNPRDRDSLVMVVHPDCPCSLASMSELAVLAANCDNQLAIRILFARPPGFAQKAESTSLWRAAEQIQDAVLVADNDGLLSRRLGATTSGQVFLYDRDQALRFSGGITDSRGHAGNNAGRLAIEAIVHGQVPVTTRTPVFGCALW